MLTAVARSRLPTRRSLAVLGVLLAVIVATLSSSLLGGRIFTSGDNIFLWPPFSAERPPGWVRPSNVILTDPLVGFNPDLLQTRADLANGVAPLWNPLVGAGHPLLATQVHAPLFPLTWLAYLLPFWSSLVWIAAAKLLLAAGGTYMLCRALLLRRGPSLLGALAFAFGAYYFAWLEHPQTNVWALLPWMLFAARRVCMTGSLRAAALLGAFSGLSWLGGHPESAAFLLGVTALYVAFELICEQRAAPPRGSRGAAWAGPAITESLAGRAGLLTLVLGLGVGIGAVVNIPFVELLGHSPPTSRGASPAPIQEGWAFFFPELWGNPSKAFNAVGPSNWAERTAYIGVLPLLFAAGSLGRRRPREQWFFVVLAVVVGATIFDTPLWADGVRKLPEANVARLDRLLIIVSLCGAMLAAYGLHRWITATGPERRRMLAIMGLAALLPLLLWVPRHLNPFSSLGSALGQLPAVRSDETRPVIYELASVWRWALISLLGLGTLALTRRRRVPTLAVALVLALTAVDLVALDRGFHGSIPAAEANPALPSVIRYLQQHQGSQRVVASGSLPANIGERYDLRDARVAIDIPYATRYEKLWTALGGVGGDEEFYEAQTPHAHHLADIFATRLVLLAATDHVPTWLHPVLKTSAGTVAVNPTALPRAWVAYDWQQSGGQGPSLALTLISSTRKLRDAPVIEGAPDPPSRPLSASPARVVSETSGTVRLQATARRDGYLLLDDSAYPGWSVSVDGHAARWLPANENFRAVAIRSGTHVVTFNYRPASVIAGTILTAICALALGVLGLVGLILTRNTTSTA